MITDMKKLGRKSLPDSMCKKKQVAVRLLDSQIEELEEMAEREGVSISYFVREAIDLVIQKHSKSKQKKGK